MLQELLKKCLKRYLKTLYHSRLPHSWGTHLHMIQTYDTDTDEEKEILIDTINITALNGRAMLIRDRKAHVVMIQEAPRTARRILLCIFAALDTLARSRR